MKYSREQIKAMTQDEYESNICKELNDAGFRHEFHGEQLEYHPDESLLVVLSCLILKP